MAGPARAPGGAVQRPAAEPGVEEALAVERRRLRRGAASAAPWRRTLGRRARRDGLGVEVDGRDVAVAVVVHEGERLVLAGDDADGQADAQFAAVCTSMKLPLSALLADEPTWVIAPLCDRQPEERVRALRGDVGEAAA